MDAFVSAVRDEKKLRKEFMAAYEQMRLLVEEGQLRFRDSAKEKAIQMRLRDHCPPRGERAVGAHPEQVGVARDDGLAHRVTEGEEKQARDA